MDAPVLSRFQEWRLRNPEKAKANVVRWRSLNKERDNENSRRWKKENRDKTRELNRQYRARKYDTRVDKIIITEIANFSSKLCGICSLIIEGDYHIDHIVPLSRNGTHTLDNVQLAHPFCNQSKGDREEHTCGRAAS